MDEGLAPRPFRETAERTEGPKRASAAKDGVSPFAPLTEKQGGEAIVGCGTRASRRNPDPEAHKRGERRSATKFARTWGRKATREFIGASGASAPCGLRIRIRKDAEGGTP